MIIISGLTTLLFNFGLVENKMGLKAGDLLVQIDAEGRVKSLYDLIQNKEYIPYGHSLPLLSLALGNKIEIPKSMFYDSNSGQLTLGYGNDDIKATIQVDIKSSHITFELGKIFGIEPSVAMWGPFPTTINRIIGETVGVVQDENFALGIQALNIHTIGGRPREYPELGIGNESHAAVVTGYGSVLQAYSRETDGGIIGSKIGIFGCRAMDVLKTIEHVEISEGLPHPMLDGVWGKISPTAKLSYLITSFNEQNLDELLDYAYKAGLKYVYHEGPFKTWGHFQLNPNQFPEGDESMRRCVEKAEKHGIRLGVHTLTNFITTNDPYVTPIPDPRLMRVGSSMLTGAIDENATEIPIANPEPFKEKQTLSTAVVGNELVRYGFISDNEPWKLLNCQRGAFGTKSLSHDAGSDIGKLWDHPYNVFFPNLEMQQELTARLVELFNNTGLRQISFDGLEGCLSTGHGFYAENLFVKQCFDGWMQEVINDASGLSHYLWHIHTRMNWGEPWGKAMREGMPEYRFKNQEYFRRNLFPRMLGWFQLRNASESLEATTLDDIEWVMAKCAGFDAGCAIATSIYALKTNGQTEQMLTAIREWEKARFSNAFSEEQLQRMRDTRNEFHLESSENGSWKLFPVYFSPLFLHRWQEQQPGQPLISVWEIENSFEPQH
ncbi:hypothetical protein FJZ33_01025, partial [Candidatus Poribacteria bacterium]|nr:hypothetical protein [Candidatus Poribacteria bacterium]